MKLLEAFEYSFKGWIEDYGDLNTFRDGREDYNLLPWGKILNKTVNSSLFFESLFAANRSININLCLDFQGYYFEPEEDPENQ